jgi:phage terminase small subunit
MTMQKNEYGLTWKQQKFADLYRGGLDEIRGNAQACYKSVYPRSSQRTAEVEASKFLRKPEIDNYLTICSERTAAQVDVTQEEVLRELQRTAFFNIQDLYGQDGNLIPIHQLPYDVAAAIGVWDVRANKTRGTSRIFIRSLDKLKALNMLARHLGMFKDNLNLAVDPIAELLRTIDGQGSTVRTINDRISRENEELDSKKESAQKHPGELIRFI